MGLAELKEIMRDRVGWGGPVRDCYDSGDGGISK